VPVAVFTFWASFASYQYPHLRTLCTVGQTVIKTTVMMMPCGVEMLQVECQGESEVGSMEGWKKPPPTEPVKDGRWGQ